MSIDINHYHQYCNQTSLVDDNKANMGRPYQQCALSVMDTIAGRNCPRRVFYRPPGQLVVRDHRALTRSD